MRQLRGVVAALAHNTFSSLPRHCRLRFYQTLRTSLPNWKERINSPAAAMVITCGGGGKRSNVLTLQSDCPICQARSFCNPDDLPLTLNTSQSFFSISLEMLLLCLVNLKMLFSSLAKRYRLFTSSQPFVPPVFPASEKTLIAPLVIHSPCPSPPNLRARLLFRILPDGASLVIYRRFNHHGICFHESQLMHRAWNMSIW